MRKRIVFLGKGIHFIPSYQPLLKKLSKEYDLFLYSEHYIDPEDRLKGFYVKTVSKRRMPRRLREILFIWMIIKGHIMKHFHIIHCHSTFPTGLAGFIVGKLFRIPVIISLDAAEGSSVKELEFRDLGNPKRKFINQLLLKRTNAVTVLTQYHKNEVIKNLDIKRYIETITRGVDEKKFSYSNKTIKKQIIILNVSYLHPVKDPETLLNCFKKVNEQIDCTLIHVGRDMCKGKYQQMAKEMGIADKIKFEGNIHYEKLPEYYAIADILLHTSRFESQAVVVNEALACGVPVCGTHVGLLADLSGSCCITTQPGDVEGLKDIVINLLKDSGKREKMIENGLKWTKENNLKNTVEKYKALYENLLNNH